MYIKNTFPSEVYYYLYQFLLLFSVSVLLLWDRMKGDEILQNYEINIHGVHMITLTFMHACIWFLGTIFSLHATCLYYSLCYSLLCVRIHSISYMQIREFSLWNQFIVPNTVKY